MSKKKLFVSLPMNNRTPQNIKLSMERMKVVAEGLFGTEFDLINSYNEEKVNNSNEAIYLLGKSIQYLSQADCVISIVEEHSRGCNIEKTIATEYGIPLCLVSCHNDYLFPDLKQEVKFTREGQA